VRHHGEPDHNGNKRYLRNALNEADYVEGRSVTVEYHWLEGHYDRLPAVIADLVRRRVAVIATGGFTQAALAAKAATATIPIVFGVGEDPVRLGLVANLAQPGGNATGINFFPQEVLAKRLGLLHDLVPKATRIAVLPDNASNVLQFEELQAVAPTLGVAVISVSVSPRIEFEAAFAAMMKERPDAFAMTAEPFHQTHIAWIIDFMAKNRLPAVYQLSETVRAGGLLSYGASEPDLFRRAAGYVHKILQGTKPADLPVELPTKFDFAVNLKAAKALGLELTPTFIARADEVIE